MPQLTTLLIAALLALTCAPYVSVSPFPTPSAAHCSVRIDSDKPKLSLTDQRTLRLSEKSTLAQLYPHPPVGERPFAREIPGLNQALFQRPPPAVLILR